MNNNFKKLFLLPSLLLTQAYCLEQCVNVNNNTNVETYSEKVKINSEEFNVNDQNLNKKNIVSSKKELSTIELLWFSLASATLAILFLKNKIKIKSNDKNFSFENIVIVILKLRKTIFQLIKSTKKIFHYIYYRIYFSIYLPKIN